jgi:predicted phosphodiesterase
MKKFSFKVVLLIVMLIQFTDGLSGQNPPVREPAGNRRGRGNQESFFFNRVPEHSFDIIQCRPTAKTVTLSIMACRNAEAYLVYNRIGDSPVKSEKITLQQNQPFNLVLKKLKPDSKYLYHLIYKTPEDKDFIQSPPYFFSTQRATDKEFTFTVTADSHLDENCDTLIYKTSLLNALSDSADFHIDLGDTFMTDKYRNNYKDALNQYIAQRYYFGQLCHSSSLFLVLGNHDGESGSQLNGSEDNMTVWSTNTRKTFFPNPVPDDFYSGNITIEPFTGNPQNYYSWKWGNALFIVLDPFRYSTGEAGNDPWQRTLGNNQYKWLKKTLEESRAPFKFVFIHNLVGGADINGRARGGAEAAGFYEWGGKNSDGTDGFKVHRPEWDMPVHSLLKKNQVNVVFHGHDHLYASQEYDGIIYQCLPQPGAKNRVDNRPSGEYGYVNGVIMKGSGYMRIKVSEKKVSAEYVITNPVAGSENKKVAHSYRINK